MKEKNGGWEEASKFRGGEGSDAVGTLAWYWQDASGLGKRETEYVYTERASTGVFGTECFSSS